MNLNFLKGDCSRHKPSRHHPWYRRVFQRPLSADDLMTLTGQRKKELPVNRASRSGVSPDNVANQQPNQ